MGDNTAARILWRLPSDEPGDGRRCDYALDLKKAKRALGVSEVSAQRFCASLPFTPGDAAAGTENELQTVVVGDQKDVDLPTVIRESSFYRNMAKRAASGDAPKKALASLEQFLDDNPENVWENSWVRFPRRALSRYAQSVFERDLLADKRDWTGPRRKDADCFRVKNENADLIRVPVSYLLKLSLADSLGGPDVHPLVRRAGEGFMGHFSNDNTSPETFSFYPAPLKRETGMGKAAARESLLRYLLCQFLTEYANETFELAKHGQKAMVYMAPHPPVRQKLLNELTSDSFYRRLFMSPCLSGWDCGEEKHKYMRLCHQVLSRSQLNATAKLKEAGIIVNNLVVLPNLSNICLANNGAHVSLSSRKLAAALQDPDSGFGMADEKYIGDLAIKIVEHFLPLFVGAYSAAPYRLAFTDFHPERALGFLPHELDFTHLRMIWRRWKKKADLKFCGHPITPFGPELLDRFISSALRLKGDFVADFRIIDYLVSLMSTDESPGLDGKLGNDRRLKEDLATLGVFHTDMPVYLLYRNRRYCEMGFSGFEGRHYSLFADIVSDMGSAVDMQMLVTALAYKYILKGRFGHGHIPDDPSVESERRQVFFGTAIGIPTFYVRKDCRNQFLARILKQTRRTRFSRRYPGYLRVYNVEYRKALVRILKEDAADLIEMADMKEIVEDLERRIDDPAGFSAGGKLTRGILDEANAKDPMKVPAKDFNAQAEKFYRHRLRLRHTKEALDSMEAMIDSEPSGDGLYTGHAFARAAYSVAGNSPRIFLMKARREFTSGQAGPDTLKKLIHLTVLLIHSQKERSEKI